MILLKPSSVKSFRSRPRGEFDANSALKTDRAKGAVAVLAAEVLGRPLLLVMASGIAPIAGHN